MLDAPGPGYPPPRNTWQFPPPEVRTRWKWIAALATVLGLVGAAGLTTLLVVLGSQDFSGLIEDEELTDTIASQCELMTATIDSMPLSGSTPQQAATIVDQNRAVELMVLAIRRENAREVRDDEPAEQWLQDWERLVDARERYARRLLRDPEASLEVPRDADGHKITERMNDVWLGDPACTVPRTLANPRTDAYRGI
ncbi:hypothetical protein [Aeromicrobium wangtongii]|uniref:Uncharacterized protein n=1 Tax=Aeromicrobium wangtongii TaxID=2969247 RepID=A0ABY5M6J5_9ACTN|nr:hypothetical protein [Aeromicrobium wangtongii]MCD9198371.1 hypothetical protein [Aeromicrobium wangtongii]UUP12402.1 hypothetical protein NQV15_11105 [Aeromicrobium wangtongii]